MTITDSIGAGALSHYGSVQNRALQAAKAGMRADPVDGLAEQGEQSRGTGCCSGYRDGELSKATFLALHASLALRAGLAS